MGSDLFWCRGGAKLPQKPTVNGTTDVLFFLVSYPEVVPNLHAIPFENAIYNNFEKVPCLHDKVILDKCNAGYRTKGLTALEKLLN